MTQRRSAGQPGRLIVDWPLLKGVIRKHLLLFLGLMGLGTIFVVVGSLIWILGGDWGGLLFGAMGLPVIGFAVVSTTQSVSYYYDGQLVGKYGVDVDGEVTSKQCDDSIDTDRDSRGHVVAQHTDRELTISYRYRYADRPYEGAFMTDDPTLFAQLRTGDRIPLKVLSFKPKSSKPRLRALKQSLKTRPREEWTPAPDVTSDRPLEISSPIIPDND